MSLTDGSGQSYPLFEYKAQTNIEWFTVKNGVETPIAGTANSSQLEVSPIETTNYFVRVTTNGVVCDSEPFMVYLLKVYPKYLNHNSDRELFSTCIKF